MVITYIVATTGQTWRFISSFKFQIPIRMTFSHASKLIEEKFKLFLQSQMVKVMKETWWWWNQRYHSRWWCWRGIDTRWVGKRSGRDIYRTSRNSYRQWTTNSGEKEIQESVRRKIDEALNSHVKDVNVMDLDIEDSLNDNNNNCILLCMIIPLYKSRYLS